MQFQSPQDAVAQATGALFSNWMALQLTVENTDPTRSGQIAQALYDQTVAMATSATKRHDQDDYVQIFYAAFDSMNTDIEDGSPEQVAEKIVAIRDAAAQGNFAPAAELVQKAGRGAAMRGRSVAGAEADADAAGAGPAGATPAPQQPPRAPAPVDDDGFTSVVRKTRR